ncbi:MAG: phospho-N-acetylmuramoyl-pentapeptide-transferase [Phycisphaerae bacterium]|nr:phospho-N-acetylmuramoyl-pentapeptide-transferase [Phycisphaerae bacterium]
MLYLLLRAIENWLVEREVYGLFRVLDQLEFRALAAAGLSFTIVVALGPRVIHWLKMKKIGDTGLSDAQALRQHMNSKQATPTMGGVLIVGAMAGAVLLLADVGQFYVQAALIVMVCFAALGAVDDWLKLTAASRGSGGRQGLYAWEKLVFQIGLAGLVGYFAFHQAEGAQNLAHVLNLPLQKTYESAGGAPAPGLVYLGAGAYVAVMTLMVAGMSNAVNITDGMDGLAAGISGTVAVGLLLLTLIAGSDKWAQYLLVPHVPVADELSVVAGAMVGACLGFLWWNCSPAQVFMGDTGALALGAVIGYSAVIVRQEVVVLLMCGVFLAEIGSVVLQVGCFKLTGGTRIFRVAPIHHHFHLGGWTEQQVVARAWIVTILLVIVGLASIKVR